MINRLFFVLIFLATLTGSGFAQSPARMSIDDHSLEVVRAGSGPYTLIFESGFGTDYKVWGQVASEMAKEQTVVLYSRAGTGQSDPVKDPGPERAVADLAGLVEKAGLRGPFILVGHSYGAFVIRGFAASHPDQVRGMVFVDPAHEQLMKELARVSPEKAARDQEIQQGFVPERFRVENEQINRIFETGRLPDFGKLPDVPVMVLTSVQERPRPELFLHEPEGIAVWRQLHTRFFSQFSSGAHWVTPNSGHNIHREEPQLVAGAIRQVIRLADQAKQRQEHARKAGVLTAALEQAAAVRNSRRAEELVSGGAKASGLAERDLNSIAYSCLNDPRLREPAVLLLKYNTLAYPASANAFDSYGEGLLALGRTGPARAQFLKAIELAEASHDEATLRNSRMNLEKIKSP